MPETGSFLARARVLTARLLPARGYDAVRRGWREVRLLLPDALMSRRLPGVPGRVHVEDGMLRDYSPQAIAEYIVSGREPVAHMEAALARAGRSWATVAEYLDYGGGYGRALRWIAAEHPAVHTSIAEVNVQAARFVAREFGSDALVVQPHQVVPHFPRSYDLIWVGSVMTHLDENDGRTLLTALANALGPNGVLVFTTHGHISPEWLPHYGPDTTARADEIAAALVRDRIFFVPGVAGRNYPQTFHAPAAVRALIASVTPRLELLSHAPRGWGNHQDVWSCRRV